jgi:hypothetical protein
VGEDVERLRGDERAEAPVRTGAPRDACRWCVNMRDDDEEEEDDGGGMDMG